MYVRHISCVLDFVIKHMLAVKGMLNTETKYRKKLPFLLHYTVNSFTLAHYGENLKEQSNLVLL